MTQRTRIPVMPLILLIGMLMMQTAPAQDSRFRLRDFYDNFSTGNAANWSVINNADNLYLMGKGSYDLYRRNATTVDVVFCRWENKNDNFEAQMGLKFDKSSNEDQYAGILVKATKTSALIAEIHQEGKVRIRRIIDNKGTYITGKKEDDGWVAFKGMKKDANQLSFVCDSTSYQVWVNGKKIAEATVEGFSAGKMGMMVGPNTRIKVDYFAVYAEEKKPEPVVVEKTPDPAPKPDTVKAEKKPEPVVVKEEKKPEPVVVKEEKKPDTVAHKADNKVNTPKAKDTVKTADKVKPAHKNPAHDSATTKPADKTVAKKDTASKAPKPTTPAPNANRTVKPATTAEVQALQKKVDTLQAQLNRFRNMAYQEQDRADSLQQVLDTDGKKDYRSENARLDEENRELIARNDSLLSLIASYNDIRTVLSQSEGSEISLKLAEKLKEEKLARDQAEKKNKELEIQIKKLNLRVKNLQRQVDQLRTPKPTPTPGKK